MNDHSPPTVGDVWSWPDGKLSVLTEHDIRQGFVATVWMGGTVTHYLRDGRRRDETHIIQIAMETPYMCATCGLDERADGCNECAICRAVTVLDNREPDPRKHPDYPRPDCDEPACGWTDPCDSCADAAYREDVAAEELADAIAGLACHKQQQTDARDVSVERTDGHHEGDPAPVIGWGESVRRVLS